MTFEYIIEPEQKKKKLDDVESEKLAQKIAATYDRYNDARQTNLDKADALIEEIFFRNRVNELDSEASKKEDQWKSKAKLGKPYMFYQTFKAFIWKNIYANINSMFDVSGENQETDNNSNKQKAYLVNIFDQMEIEKPSTKLLTIFCFMASLFHFQLGKRNILNTEDQ